MAFTELCIKASGNNLNAGSVDGSSTEPATTPLVTYTGGDWVAATDVYTAPIGADMTEAQVGRFASLYHDGDTAPTTNQYLVARITAVDSGARTITLSTTARALRGTEVADGTGNRSLRIGGAWSGPAGAEAFPFNLTSVGSLENASAHNPRFNVKSDQTISISAMITTTAGQYRIQGYTSSYGDEGLGIFDGGTSGTAYSLLNLSANVHIWDVEVRNNGATGGTSTYGIGLIGATAGAFRCIAHDLRGHGIFANNSADSIWECEAYNCNQGNIASHAGIVLNAVGARAIRCKSYDHTTANSSGFQISTGGTVIECIAYGNAGPGFRFLGNNNVNYFKNCDAYANGGNGFELTANANTQLLIVENCNALDNGGYGIGWGAGTSPRRGVIANCGFGSGTMANTSGTVETGFPSMIEIDSVTYAADVTPWVDPDNGDFRISLAAAKNAGRGFFRETSGNDGTVGYPDIGAAQHEDAAAAAGGGAPIIGSHGPIIRGVAA